MYLLKLAGESLRPKRRVKSLRSSRSFVPTTLVDSPGAGLPPRQGPGSPGCAEAQRCGRPQWRPAPGPALCYLVCHLPLHHMPSEGSSSRRPNA
eukprot:5568850-Amphidinium_carterae.1